MNNSLIHKSFFPAIEIIRVRSLVQSTGSQKEKYKKKCNIVNFRRDRTGGGGGRSTLFVPLSTATCSVVCTRFHRDPDSETSRGIEQFPATE